jgi:hypothetical protein
MLLPLSSDIPLPSEPDYMSTLKLMCVGQSFAFRSPDREAVKCAARLARCRVTIAFHNEELRAWVTEILPTLPTLAGRTERLLELLGSTAVASAADTWHGTASELARKIRQATPGADTGTTKVAGRCLSVIAKSHPQFVSVSGCARHLLYYQVDLAALRSSQKPVESLYEPAAVLS